MLFRVRNPGTRRYRLWMVITALLASAIAAAQKNPIPQAFPAFSLSENSLLVTDYDPTDPPGVCSGPGRLIRILDVSPTGWEAGPTVSGLTFDNPTKVSFDSIGRIYVADRDNRRIVRMDDVAG